MTAVYELIRSKRRTLAIVIDSEGKCTVRAPLQARVSAIEQFVQLKTAWIIKKQQQCAAQKQAQQLLLQDGLQLPVLDRRLTLRLVSAKRAQVIGTALLCPAENPQRALEKWLRQQALAVLQDRVAYYASLMGVAYRSVKLSSAAKRWGSCSTQGNLNFAWRLVFYPVAVLDYVVVHELSHIGNMNHSRRFWQRVASVMPDYQERQQYLKQHGYLLQWLR